MMRTTDGKLAILDFGLMTEVTVSLPCGFYSCPNTLLRPILFSNQSIIPILIPKQNKG